MGWYRCSRLHYLISTITALKPKPPIRNPVPVVNHNHQFGKFTCRTSYPNKVTRIWSFPSLVVNRSLGVRSFGTRYRYRYNGNDNSLRKHVNSFVRFNSFNSLTVLLVGSGIVATIYYGYVETIPYTKRKHVLILSQSSERKLGESTFKKMKDKTYKGKILPATDPSSVRVTKISKDIINALQRGLKKESKGGKSGYAYLEGLKWEVLVVKNRTVNAFCVPGGKIVVFTGLLKHLTTDEEIATIIGHEVAHAVARHSAENITKKLWFTMGELIMWQYVDFGDALRLSYFLLELPFSRRMELEADHIGLLLMASAGYNPRAAPKVFEKLSKVGVISMPFQDYISTHPSGKTRSKLLSEARVMKEALALYEDAIAQRQVDGFLL